MPFLFLTQLPVSIADEVAAFFELEHFSGVYYWATREQLNQLTDYLGQPVETFANKTRVANLIICGNIFVEEKELLRRLY